MWHAAVGAVVALGFVHCLRYDWPFEDAYITFRYAENLLRGVGLRYNPGETVEGFTSFGWVMILAAVGALGASIPVVAKLLALACGVMLVALTAVAARRFVDGEHDRWGASALPAALVATNGTWAYYTMTAMETSLFALLVTVAVVLATRDDRRGAIACGLVVAAAAMVRPEGMGYFGLLWLALATDARGRRQLVAYTAAFAAVFVPYFAWRWSHFGYPLPNTYYAKASPGAGVFRAGFDHFEEYFTTHLFWLAAAAAIYVVVTHRTRWARVCAIVLAGACVNVIFVGGDAFAFYRFLLPAIPAGAILLYAAGRRLATRGWGARAALLVGAAALIAWTASAPDRSRSSLTRSRPETQRERGVRAAWVNDHYFAVGAWLRATFPPDTLIATNAAGIIPYEARLPTIDMLGLNDEHIAHLDIELGRGALGHEKHDADYVLAREPDVILLGLPVLVHRPVQSPSELRTWFGKWFDYLPGDRELFEHPQFRAAYRPFSVQVEPGRWLTLFVRRGSEPR